MNRMMAIVEREMRKFFRSPALMLASMIFPLVQLIILGNAFGGKIHDARVAIVDQDGGTAGVAGARGLRLGPRQHPHLRSHLLRQRQAGHGRRAQRQAARRGHHPAAVFAPRVRGEPSAHRAGRRQQRQLHELGGRSRADRLDQLRSISPRSRPAFCSRPRSILSSSIPISNT